MKWFGKTGAEDSFVRLVQVAREDPAVRRALMEILGHAPDKRRLELGRMIDRMVLAKAPEELTDALKLLAADEAADRARDLLGEAE